MLSLVVAGNGRAADAPPATSPQRPNVVFIFADDHAAQAVSAYGSRINQTPNIDRIAQEGMLFRNCLVPNSICTPSRATILTGKHSHLNGTYNVGDRFDGTQQTFPKLLQRAGYQTAIVGKWHLGQGGTSDPTGFDYWNVLVGQGPYYNPPMIENGRKVQHTGYTTDIITDITLDWLKAKRDPGKPFMLMYQHKSPHRPWDPDAKHLTMYDDRDIPEPANLFDDHANRASPARTQEMEIGRHLTARDLKLDGGPPGLTSEQQQAWDAAYGPKNKAFADAKLSGDDLVRWKYQRYIKDYLRCIASMDENIGRVLKFLDDNGLSQNTVVIYSSDQGFYLGEHGWFDKRFMYEESLRTPLVVRWPGVVKPGSESAALVSNLDFAQTFLDMAGATQPADMQGASLVPLLRGQTPDGWRKSVYYHYYDFPAEHAVQRHYGVRTERYKLICYYDVRQWELFDLQTDPHEMKSVCDDPKYADVRRELEAELKRLQSEYKDTNPDAPVSEIRRLTGRTGKPANAGQIPASR
jgi:arylsulfatase A-like enzyme